MAFKGPHAWINWPFSWNRVISSSAAIRAALRPTRLPVSLYPATQEGEYMKPRSWVSTSLPVSMRLKKLSI